MGKKEHAPSAYRKIIRNLKSSNVNINKLVEEARALSDPYYSSLALFSISVYDGLENKLASKLKPEAFGLANKEKRPWRRAELIISICKLSKNNPEIIKLIEQIPEPKARAEAIAGTAKHLGCENAPELLKLAVRNGGYETDSCKPVIKFWAAECPEFELMLDILGTLKNPESGIRLLGYLQLQFSRAGIQTTEPIEMAVDHALKNPDKLGLLKYLASQSDDIDSLEAIAMALTGLDTPLEEASLLATLAGSADRAGHKELAMDWFNSSLECLEDVDGVPATLRLNLALGLRKLGQEELASKNFQIALDSAGDNEKLRYRIEKAMGVKPKKIIKSVEHTGKRHVLALHDTYQGKLSSAHVRMIARAAPLCIAYDIDLALLDFPIKDLDSLVRMVSANTNVGKGGRYLRELFVQNRVMLIDDPNEAGMAIATTSRPEKAKSISLKEAARMAQDHPTRRMCVIMGLGRNGLPKKLLADISHHAEVTGSNVPLETSTAMGIIAQMIGHVSHPKF